MKPVLVVGAGFSGLTLAYALNRLKVPVRVVERGERAGGLISTHNTEWGLVETAANALLADRQIERLFNELDLPFAPQLKSRKRRYIFWQKPRRWPLSLWTTFRLAKFFVLNFLAIGSVAPRPRETVSGWAKRVLDGQFETRLLAPALQGVYAGDTGRLSAPATLSGFFSRHERGKLRGSVSPRQGMGELISALETQLRQSGVEIEYGRAIELSEKLEQPTVICTSAWAASEIVRGHDPVLAKVLASCESSPLITVTGFFELHAKDLQGFGCLFPKEQQFHSLGVLFNDCIFAGRSSLRSETWILGGALNPDICSLSDEQIKSQILEDRLRLPGGGACKGWSITRWPKALPHYTVAWEECLRGLKVNRPLFLHGNYLGQLGLARIQHRSEALAAQLKDLYVS